jgi:Ca2+-binding RTX toxin-like protein
LIGDRGDNTLRGKGGDDTPNGGIRLDWADYRDVAAVTVNLRARIATGADGSDTRVGVENARGSNFHDTLNGSKGANVLRGKVETTN